MGRHHLGTIIRGLLFVAALGSWAVAYHAGANLFGLAWAAIGITLFAASRAEF